MKINFLAKEAHYVEIEIVGEDHSLPNALRELILQDDDVEFAAYKMPHPQIANPVLIVRTKSKNALAIVKSAAKELSKQAKEMREEFESSHAHKKKAKQ
ncbi:MAG: DNA-directed RNA polymerase subunit L [Candidatus Micrarchaeia archaeon]